MKLFIKNRKGQKISVLVEEQKNTKGLAFIMHGLGGFKEQDYVRNCVDAFLEKGFTVVSFDTTNSFGESDGDYADATTTNYYEDLEDVVSWASKQEWYFEPVFLIGHSLGGTCVALYAQKHPEKIKGVAPLSTVISGKLSLEAHTKDELEEWSRTGWRIKPSATNPSRIKKLKWNPHIEDRMKYDLLVSAGKMRMPVLMVVGEKDDTTLPRHQRLLFEKLTGDKELHIIKDAPHTFKEPKHLKQTKKILLKWIEKVNK